MAVGAPVGPESGEGHGEPQVWWKVIRLRILRTSSPAAPNAIAAILLALRDATGVRPHCHFEWSEGRPIGHLMRYLILGRGDTPPLVREILRKVEPETSRRPGIHVGG